jgi:hypothetical protein
MNISGWLKAREGVPQEATLIARRTRTIIHKHNKRPRSKSCMLRNP